MGGSDDGHGGQGNHLRVVGVGEERRGSDEDEEEDEVRGARCEERRASGGV